MSRIGSLGFGEIGQSISRLYDKPVTVKDLNRIDDGFEELDVLQVCIPWSEEFADIVLEEMYATGAKLTIINSTIKPGTTKTIVDRSFGKLPVVHSPVRGMHPDLTESIQTFIKYIGADDISFSLAAEEHFKSIGVKTKSFMPSTSTEVGKLLSTSYYGIIIAWHAEMKRYCDKHGVDFEVMKDFNNSYNDGYRKMGRGNVVRPTLDPPEGMIGGHCVRPNAEMILEDFNSDMLDDIVNCNDGGLSAKDKLEELQSYITWEELGGSL